MPDLTSKGISLADLPKNLTAMALHVKIDKTRRLITAHGTGEISDADITAMEQTFENNPDFSPKFSRICDLTDATGVSVSDEFVTKWAKDPIMEGTARHAFVCTRPAIMGPVLEFVRQSRAHSREVLVFPTFSQAENWVERRPE
jgi:hypothetical protein